MFRMPPLVAMAVVFVAVPVAMAQRDNAAAKPTSYDSPTDIAGLKALEQQIRKIVERVTPSVVYVSGGTGVVISEDGLVLTVAHVAARAGRDVTVTFPDGRRVRGKTLGNDHGADAGLIRIAGDGPWPHCEMGRSENLRAGQWCLAFGYPVKFEHGKPPALRIGRVQQRDATAIITDCTIMGGDSGGPLFDLEGKVIGISSRCDDAPTANVHVPINVFHDKWERLVKGEDFNSYRDPVAYLGVTPDDTATDARIERVFQDSAAEKAGILPGDVIVQFDGTAVKQYDDLPRLIRNRKPGERVKIEIRRGEETVNVEATLGSRGG